MAGLLDSLFGTPEKAQAMGLLGANLMAGNGPQGFLAANNFLAEAPDRKLARDYKLAQLAEVQAQADERKTLTAQRQAELEQAARIRAGLPGLYRSGGISGGQAIPQAFAGTDVPVFSKPAGVAPMRQEPGGFDVQGALTLGITDPDKLAKYAGLANINRPKATRQMEVDDGRGGKRIALVDDFGQEVAGFAGYTAPVQVNQGDRVSFIKPAPGVSLGVNQSPDSKASNALGWANNALTRRGQDLTDRRAGAQAEREKWTYDPTRGGLVNMQSGEFKPAMQNGQPVGTKKDEAEIKRTGAQQRVSRNLDSLAGAYDELSEMGGVIDTDRGAVPNVGNRIAASGAGQLVAGAMGTKEQSLRNRINQMRPLLLQEIRQATEMGARGLDSNKELEFYLQAATDPARDIQANKAAIQVLENAYGLSSKVGGVNPSQVGALRDEFKRVGPRSDSGKVGAEPPKITSDDDYNALPSGAEFLAPDGTRRRKP